MSAPTSHPMRRGTDSPETVRELQRDLRALGYLRRGIDGDFGRQTEFAVTALRHDLLHNDGSGRDGTAPVAIRDYNRGRVTDINGTVDKKLAACIDDLIKENDYPKVPSSQDPAGENRRALQTIDATNLTAAPKPWLLAMLRQESGLQHFQVPRGSDEDNFVTVGLDQRDRTVPAITSRGYGLGQYTLFHHPPTEDEVNDFILDPIRNLDRAVREFREKFDRFVVSSDPVVRADDRFYEHPGEPLRLCKYATDDPRHLTDCRNCLNDINARDIVMNQTPLHPGTSQFYTNTPLYRPGNRRYENVPVRAEIPCDWPYAARRYNGSGVNSYHYQALAMLRTRGELSL